MDVALPGLAVVLIVIQVGDAILCFIPAPFISRALDGVDCPSSIRKVIPFVKLDSAVGLVIGLWVPWVGGLTTIALVVYFLIAIGFHVRVHDTVKNSIPAVAMLAFVAAVGVLSYLPAI